LQHNAAAPALPLFEALAASGSHTVTLPLDRTGANTLQLNVTSPESY
jgi:hypothetical protein